jgi:tRNA (guanine37-N1)-methyltransferase
MAATPLASATAALSPSGRASPALQIAVVTLFPEMIESAVRYGITGRALENGLWRLTTVNPRDFTTDNYRTIDDRPYGGGPGMVMLPGPLEAAIDRGLADVGDGEISAAEARGDDGGAVKPVVVYLSPQGEKLTHTRVMSLKNKGRLVLLAGRYEGIDERLLERRVDVELSIGDYVLSGGELPALVVIDALVRQLPGATNDPLSIESESFVDGLLDCPHYTRPDVHAGMVVPPVLMSGNHAEIRRWRLKQSLGRTWRRRPDLIAQRSLSREEARLLDEYRREHETEVQEQQEQQEQQQTQAGEQQAMQR